MQDTSSIKKKKKKKGKGIRKKKRKNKARKFSSCFSTWRVFFFFILPLFSLLPAAGLPFVVLAITAAALSIRMASSRELVALFIILAIGGTAQQTGERSSQRSAAPSALLDTLAWTRKELQDVRLACALKQWDDQRFERELELGIVPPLQRRCALASRAWRAMLAAQTDHITGTQVVPTQAAKQKAPYSTSFILFFFPFLRFSSF